MAHGDAAVALRRDVAVPLAESEVPTNSLFQRFAARATRIREAYSGAEKVQPFQLS